MRHVQEKLKTTGKMDGNKDDKDARVEALISNFLDGLRSHPPWVSELMEWWIRAVHKEEKQRNEMYNETKSCWGKYNTEVQDATDAI